MEQPKRITHHNISGATENLEYDSMRWDKIFDEVVLILKDKQREHLIPLKNIARLSYRPEVKVEGEPAEQKGKK